MDSRTPDALIMTFFIPSMRACSSALADSCNAISVSYSSTEVNAVAGSAAKTKANKKSWRIVFLGWVSDVLVTNDKQLSKSGQLNDRFVKNKNVVISHQSTPETQQKRKY